jgi:hypothetical protein
MTFLPLRQNCTHQTPCLMELHATTSWVTLCAVIGLSVSTEMYCYSGIPSVDLEGRARSSLGALALEQRASAHHGLSTLHTCSAAGGSDLMWSCRMDAGESKHRHHGTVAKTGRRGHHRQAARSFHPLFPSTSQQITDRRKWQWFIKGLIDLCY